MSISSGHCGRRGVCPGHIDSYKPGHGQSAMTGLIGIYRTSIKYQQIGLKEEPADINRIRLTVSGGKPYNPFLTTHVSCVRHDSCITVQVRHAAVCSSGLIGKL